MRVRFVTFDKNIDSGGVYCAESPLVGDRVVFDYNGAQFQADVVARTFFAWPEDKNGTCCVCCTVENVRGGSYGPLRTMP